MTEIFEAIYEFLSQLGIPVYPENGVPTDAVLPYISWDPVQTNWDSEGLMPVRIWDRSKNYERVSALADALGDLIDPEGGATLIAGKGNYIHLFRDEPWCQPQPIQDTDIKVLYINIGISTMIH